MTADKQRYYETLYQKWDLYLPFMERGLKMLARNGAFSMIVPFPISNQLYGQKFRKWVAEHYNVFEIADLNGTKVFDSATVSNLILFAKNNGKTTQTVISNIDDKREITPIFVQDIENLVQDDKKVVWNFTQQHRDTGKHSDMYVLGDFCYISYGLRPNSDEKEAKGEFKKEDLISDEEDDVPRRKYIEAKDIEKYKINRVRFLEYGTDRSPAKLARPTFRSLYEPEKLMFNVLGNLIGTFDDNKLIHNHSLIAVVLWKDLKGENNLSIKNSIKKFSKYNRETMETLSEKVDLKYLLGVMNSRYASQLLANLRGDDYHIYPEHVRNIPIPLPTKETQKEIAQLVDKIMEAKKSNQDSQTEEREIDRLVYELYGLTEEEKKIVEDK